MSKATLARRVGAVRSYVTKLENEEIQPSSGMMLRLAHVFQRPVEDIFQLAEKPSGKAAFHPLSRRVSACAGEFTNMAENEK
jgi:DNA-binding XRE family transcriptional regulator